MTYEELAAKLEAEIQARGKLSLSNVANSVLGIAQTQKTELQKALDALLNKTGTVSDTDQTAIQALLDKQKSEAKERSKIIVRNTVIAVGTFALGIGFWFTFRHGKKINKLK